MHYLKVCLRFDIEMGFIKYDVVDGGYEKMPPKPYPSNRQNKRNRMERAFAVWVEDVGKPFSMYAEEALNVYHAWVNEDPSHRIFKVKVRSKDDSSRGIQPKESGMEK